MPQQNLDYILVPVIEDLSKLKYFYMWCLGACLDTNLEKRGIIVGVGERNRLMKKAARTLERLGYRNHAGGEQTVEIERSY